MPPATSIFPFVFTFPKNNASPFTPEDKSSSPAECPKVEGEEVPNAKTLIPISRKIENVIKV